VDQRRQVRRGVDQAEGVEHAFGDGARRLLAGGMDARQGPGGIDPFADARDVAEPHGKIEPVALPQPLNHIHCEPGNGFYLDPLANSSPESLSIQPGQPVMIVIGPEGGFS